MHVKNVNINDKTAKANLENHTLVIGIYKYNKGQIR